MEHTAASAVELPRSARWFGVVYLLPGVGFIAAALDGAALMRAPLGVWMFGVGFACVFTRYRWTGGELVTEIGPFAVRAQRVTPEIVRARGRFPSLLVVAADGDAQSECPPFFAARWARRHRRAGDAVVLAPWPLPARQWAEIIGVPFRPYPALDGRAAAGVD